MVTVLMPTYNCAAYISDAIKSILNQTFKEYEFLIIDDGSTDSTQEIVSNFNDSRIRCIHKKNSGLADSLNYGLSHATFDLIARMDADDIAHPMRILKQVKTLTQKPNIDVIASWFAVFSGSRIKYIVKTPENNEEIVHQLTLYSTIPHSGCMYNRNQILKSGGYLGEVFEDYSLWLKLKDKIKFYNIQEVLTFVRYRRNSLSRTNLTLKHSIIYKIQEPYYQNLGAHFVLSNVFETNKIKAWREYFYGAPKLARKLWRSSAKYLVKDYRISIAYLISLLPIKVFLQFKEARIKFRMQYLINYCKKENKVLRREFSILLKR